MIDFETQILFDDSRNREIPIKIYKPKLTEVGVVVFSHGLGGSMESYQYYAEYLARHGFKCVHPTHKGIDDSLLKEKRPFQVLKEAAEQKENKINPALDIKFILDHLGLDNICMAGHSFGAFTTLLLSGQYFAEGNVNLKDTRIKAAIAMSPHAVLINPELAYKEIKIPILHITGKKDDSPFGLFEPIQRRIPFDNILGAEQYLVLFEEADHMVFAAKRKGNKFSTADVNIMSLTCEASLEFLKKYLLNSHSVLDAPEFADKLAAHAIFEQN